MNWVYYLMAICAGLGITLQTTLNAQLAKGVGGDSVAAALFSFTAGALCLGIYSLIRGGIVASLIAIPAQPWWSLLGGLLGAGALLSYVVLAPKVGLSALLGLAYLYAAIVVLNQTNASFNDLACDIFILFHVT